MPKGQPAHTTIRNPAAPYYWSRFEFPTLPLDERSMHGTGAQWFAARNTRDRPFCWTPTRGFHFGDCHFVPLYPCVAYATANFGWIFQCGPQGIILGRE